MLPRLALLVLAIDRVAPELGLDEEGDSDA
jgi:hypothetical protein